ncbi:MAG TPA: PEGA domain-containing protein, partial [Polyangiales bacterium]|nr:PEGA domain-containing protein [Polyangiales bacterium]
WADVFVDGELLATTPIASRIPLSPGKHYVKLVNPFFQEESHEIVIRSGVTQSLDAKLAPRRDHPQTSGGNR